MKFEHTIDVNDTDGSASDVPLTRAQVWQGLWARVWKPDLLPNGPSSCTCTPAGEHRLHRVLRFGAHEFHDTVELLPDACVRFTPQAHDETAAIGLTIRLDEPIPGQPRLVFVYEALSALSEEEALYSGYRQNAWRLADHDMVRAWRTWLAQGQWPVAAA